jgi:hypothetical protein
VAYDQKGIVILTSPRWKLIFYIALSGGKIEETCEDLIVFPEHHATTSERHFTVDPWVTTAACELIFGFLTRSHSGNLFNVDSLRLFFDPSQ